MKSQLISNYPFSDVLDGVEIPVAVKVEIEKRGMSANPIFVKPMIDTGIHFKKREPMRERDLSTEEFLNMFDKADSLKMAYVPHFITQCVIYYLDLLVEYARDCRLSNFKKHTRLLRQMKEEYLAALRHEMPPHVFEKFLAQRDEYLASCGANLSLLYFTFGNQILKKYGRIDHEALYCYANIITAFINYVEDFDRDVNKRIEKKLGMPCRNHGDARLTAIKTVCNDIIKPYPLEKNNDTELCVGVMANKAVIMINNML